MSRRARASLRAAYFQGWDDFRSGIRFRDCPFPEFSKLASRWERGWNDSSKNHAAAVLAHAQRNLYYWQKNGYQKEDS